MSRWTDGSIPGMAPNGTYPGYKGSGRVKGIARRLRELKRTEAEVRDEFTHPLRKAIFRKLSPEDQKILIEAAESEPDPPTWKQFNTVIS